MSVVFVVLGEGRGHMTQALALASHLRDGGHRVTGVLVGTSPYRALPQYFIDEIKAPVETFEAPTLVPDSAQRSMSRWRTTVHSLNHTAAFLRSIAFIRRRIEALSPNIVVNFYDLLAGITRLISPKSPPFVAVAHNYLLSHPDSAPAPNGFWAHSGLKLLSRGTGLRASRRLALSYDQLSNYGALTCVPPLLRPGLDTLTVSAGRYLLAYALNPGYAGTLAAWQASNPQVEVHCYVEGGDANFSTPPRSKFFVHDLDSTAFLRHLAGCRAFVGTAGFESTCEAFYLSKPVLTIPVEGQYEQRFNAADAERVGAARAGTYDDLDGFWRDPPIPDPQSVQTFRAWIDSAPKVFVSEMEEVCGHIGVQV